MNPPYLSLTVGKEMDLHALMGELTSLGYRRQDKIDQSGEFSSRGGIVDIFPVHFSLPVRIELSADTIESIGSFDYSSGVLLDSHQSVILLSAKELKKPRQPHAPIAYLMGERPIDPFVDIREGDYVVHLIHGIGKFIGRKKLKDKDEDQNYFAIAYQDNQILYVPEDQLYLLQRYVSMGKMRPQLSKLGSKQWLRIRERARKGIESLASEMLDTQAKRFLLPGFQFTKDNEWQSKLEEGFPYEETPDQIRAAEEVKRDMESSAPMDRLLCGDVGYGKTEVALRAAFKAANNGKQAALLVPTTLLAEQHYETFTERLKDFPVTIRILSRFQSKAEQKEILKEMANGSCDLVIGTHRLLSDDVGFKDLGLLIIDEEQRFGVQHKEHLKKMRFQVDVLTLTATPIPRTLYLSLIGAKDMSTIQTPPKNRLPVKTVVGETNNSLIREAILKEINRNGQSFYVHNRVEEIEHETRRIRQLVPQARIGVAHGQMPGRALEKVMHDFIHRQVDVLICTTIVESGIDIPNANTLIVNRADTFGLSELYQLRGRVGRFNREAYAYFLIPKQMVLSAESKERLGAIESFSHLGAGFQLALKDLEIRGAGNILGAQQHGYIVNIGFDLYCRLLRDSIETLKSSKKLT